MKKGKSTFNERRRFLRTFLALPPGLVLTAVGGCGGGDAENPGGAHDNAVDRRIAVVPGVALHVRDWNPGYGGRTIVLLAGLGANAQCFNSIAAELSQRARVLAVTRRGYGRSDKPLPSAGYRYDPVTLADDLASLLSALQVSRVILCGHSIAGNELTAFAGRYPQRVQGLAYLDTTYDYTRPEADPGEPLPQNPALDEPAPAAADLASLDAFLAYRKRISRNWFAPLEADVRDAIEVQPDGSIRDATPAEVAVAMEAQGHAFTPDYRAVKAPALVVSAIPGDIRDLFPWLPRQVDAATLKDARTVLRIFCVARRADAALLAAALPDSRSLEIDNSTHPDFYIAYQSRVVRAIESMPWY